MRRLFLIFATVFFLTSPALAATSGAYAASEAATADVCARRCADDGLCMMWVYRAPNMCLLRASVVSNLEAVAAGVSPRAPQFARATNVVVVAPVASAAALPPSPPPRRPRQTAVLLGAPDTDRNGLRSRIGD